MYDFTVLLYHAGNDERNFVTVHKTRQIWVRFYQNVRWFFRRNFACQIKKGEFQLYKQNSAILIKLFLDNDLQDEADEILEMLKYNAIYKNVAENPLEKIGVFISGLRSDGRGAGIDNLLYSADAEFSCFADLALVSPGEYYKPGEGSLIQAVRKDPQIDFICISQTER